jgi:hypothetical protein
LYPSRLLPSTDAWRLKFVGHREEDDVLGIYTKVTTQVESAIHSDIVIVTV